MTLEVAVDGVIDIEEAEKICSNKFPSVNMKLIDLNDYSNNLVMNEVIEDGIQLQNLNHFKHLKAAETFSFFKL